MKLDKTLGLAVMLSSGAAFAAGEECQSNADCGSGELCAPAPCLPVACDPDDESCEPPSCPSSCVAVEDGGGSDGGDGGSMNGCESDTDCPTGFSCEVMGSMGSGCVCPEGQPDCGCGEPTEPVEYKGCSPKPCSTDADCGEGLECVTFEMPCAMPAIDCAPGSECPEPEPCESGTSSQCQPKWAGTCDADADCGEGFTCKAYEECSCSGSSGSGSGGSTPEPTDPAAPDGGGAPPSEDGDSSDPIDSECTCAPSEEKYCEPVKTVCTSDADCPAEWECEAFTVAVSGGGATDTACAEGQSCEAPEPAPVPEEPESESLCVPPYYTSFAEAGALPPRGPMADGEAFPTKGSQDDNGGSPTGGSGDGGGSENPEDGATGGTGSSSEKAAGCTVDGKGTPNSFAALGLVLLVAFGLRRRS